LATPSNGVKNMAEAPDDPGIVPSRLASRKYKWYAEDDNSKLHEACYFGHYDSALMLLLANGANPSIRNKLGETPLHQCAGRNHTDLMMLLLDAGAHVNALDNESLTPLHQSLIHGYRDATQLLLAYGASVHRSSPCTRSPVQYTSPLHVCRDIIKEAEGVSLF
jgi:ankyrin repeat protein